MNVLAAVGLAAAFAGLSAGQAPQSAQPATAAAGDDAARVNRLLTLAAQLADEGQDAVPLLTEAARLCGFVIWTEQRKPIAEPLGSPRLGLALTDTEIRDYCLMYRTGHRVRLGDLIAGLDVLYHLIVAKGSIEPHVADWLQTGQAADNPSVRALTTFIGALARNHERPLDVTFDADTLLDPIQALLIVRVVTEEMGVPYRRALKKLSRPQSRSEPRTRFMLAAYTPEAAVTEMPGSAEDAFAGGITNLINVVETELARRGASVLEKVAEGTSHVNAIATVAKFIATYTMLKGELRVEDPGQPLVRTKDTTPGEQRTLVARFYIDGTRVTDWLKEHRMLATAAGLDLDMPHSGALKDIETQWEFGQSRKYYTKQLIHFVSHDKNMDRIKTDANGEARLTVEGNPQPVAIDPLKARPVEKSVRISVTPQSKGTEITQDMVDAVTGAIGVKDGPGLGWLTPVIECLYRMKWMGTIGMTLQVRDWQAVEVYGQLTVEIHERGTEFTKDSARVETINRVLTVTDMPMTVSTVAAAPAIPQTVLDRMAPEARKSMEELKKKAGMQYFFAKGPGSVSLNVDDTSLNRHQAMEGCGGGVSTNSWTSNTSGGTSFEYDGPRSVKHPLAFNWQVDTEPQTNKVRLRLRAACSGTNVTTFKVGGEPPKTTTRPCDLEILGNLRLLVDVSKGIEFPLQETSVPGDENANYYGVTKLPFTFGAGDKFKGNALISFSVTRKLPKKPG